MGAAAIWLVAVTAIAQRPVEAARQGGGWILPQGAAAEKSPVTPTDATLAAGKKVFTSKCERCHGPAGKGNGQDANAKYQHDMDLTKADDVADNPDGVVFYKIWNGRSSPRMPAFSDQLSKEQAWSVVAYVQSLRPRK
jgi:mono/diheme cytochrome c family protein